MGKQSHKANRNATGLLLVSTLLLSLTVTLKGTDGGGELKAPLNVPKIVWEKTFASTPDPTLRMSAGGQRIAFGPGTDQLFVYDRTGREVTRFHSPKASKLYVRDLSSDGGRMLCEGLRAATPEGDLIQGTAWLINTSTGAMVLEQALNNTGEVGEHPLSLTADGRFLLVAMGDFNGSGYFGMKTTFSWPDSLSISPAPDKNREMPFPARLLDDRGKILWQADNLNPPISSGGGFAFLSSDGERSFLLIDEETRLTCVNKRGYRCWDYVLVGPQKIRVSPDGRFLFLFGQRSDRLGLPPTERPFPGYDTWPIMPPSNMKEPWAWEGGYAARSWGGTDSLALLLGVRTDRGNRARNYVEVLWGHTESWLGGAGRVYDFPETGISEAAIGNGPVGLTIAARRGDGMFLYVGQPGEGEHWREVRLPLSLETTDHFTVTQNGEYILTLVKVNETVSEATFWNRQGESVGSYAIPGRWLRIALSEDGKAMAVATSDNHLIFYENTELLSRNLPAE